MFYICFISNATRGTKMADINTLSDLCSYPGCENVREIFVACTESTIDGPEFDDVICLKRFFQTVPHAMTYICMMLEEEDLLEINVAFGGAGYGLKSAINRLGGLALEKMWASEVDSLVKENAEQQVREWAADHFDDKHIGWIFKRQAS